VLTVLDGSLKWHTPATEGVLEQDGVLLLNPGESASLAPATKNSSVRMAIVSLEPSLLLDAALHHNFVSREVEIKLRSMSVADDRRIARISSDLRDELLNSESGQATYVNALVEQLVIHLLRKHTVLRASSALELSRVGLVDRRIRRAIELMHAQMERELPLEELAAAAYLSPFHFARLFKKLTGYAPHAYLSAIRTAEAERLLAKTDLSVIEISQKVGYSSSSHFAKAFRQATGLSPRAFRSALVQT
jgi:AraC family transcriptional regulator